MREPVGAPVHRPSGGKSRVRLCLGRRSARWHLRRGRLVGHRGRDAGHRLPLPYYYVYNSESPMARPRPPAAPGGRHALAGRCVRLCHGCHNSILGLCSTRTASTGGVGNYGRHCRPPRPGLGSSTGTMTFPSGLTLAPDHNWMLDLYGTSSRAAMPGRSSSTPCRPLARADNPGPGLRLPRSAARSSRGRRGRST